MKKYFFIFLLILLIVNINIYGQESGVEEYFSDSSQYTQFIRLVENYFEEKNVEIKIGDGYVEIIDSDSFFGKLGLTNLAQICAQQVPSLWEDIIADHFNKVENVLVEEKEIQVNISDFNMIKKYLMPRLYPVDYVSEELKKSLIVIPFSDEIDIHIVYDMPSSVKSVKLDEFSKWNRQKDDVLNISISNLRTKYEYSIEQINVDEGIDIYYISCDSELFSSSYVLLFNDNKNLIGNYGSIIGMPNRYGVICYKVESKKANTFLNMIIPVMVNMFKDGPGSLSYNLYWYDKEHFKKIELTNISTGYFYKLPEELAEMIEEK